MVSNKLSNKINVMNMKSIIPIVFTGIVIGLFGCSEAERLDHLDADKPAPERVTSVEVTAMPGGAVITYELPDDPNLSYVKAVYEIQPGVIRETKASRYYDTLRVEGFGSTGSYPIKIFSVGKNEKSSEPVEVSVNPLTPPVLSVFSSIELDATFGGVKVSFENASKANLAIVVLVDRKSTRLTSSH